MDLGQTHQNPGAKYHLRFPTAEEGAEWTKLLKTLIITYSRQHFKTKYAFTLTPTLILTLTLILALTLTLTLTLQRVLMRIAKLGIDSFFVFNFLEIFKMH